MRIFILIIIIISCFFPKEILHKTNVLTIPEQNLSGYYAWKKNLALVNTSGFINDSLKTDNTAFVQNVIDAALKSPSHIASFEKGKIYWLSSVNLYPGLVLNGNGCTFKRLPNQGKWNRMLTTQQLKDQSRNDSMPLIIENIILDGNRSNQGEYKKYELEQQAILFLTGNTSSSQRLKVIIKNITVQQSAADGVHIYVNTDAQITNCVFLDCFRGGITATGGYSKVSIDHCKFDGSDEKGYIQFEGTGKGYNGSYKIEGSLTNLTVNGNFDIAVKDSSYVYGRNIQCKPNGFVYFNFTNSIGLFDSCTFYISNSNGKINRIVRPHVLAFRDCTFYLYSNSQNQNQSEYFWPISFNTSYSQSARQIITFDKCKFLPGNAFPSGTNSTYALYVLADKTNLNNKLVISNSYIDPAFKYGVFFKRGGNFQIKNTSIQAINPIYLGQTLGGYQINASINNLKVANKNKQYIKVNQLNPETSIQIDGVTSKEKLNQVQVDKSIN